MTVYTTRRGFLTATGAVGLAATLGPSALAYAETVSGGPHMYVAGDSTASTYRAKEAPRAGWGQALPVFLASGVRVVNAATSGRSSKSFIDEGRLASILTAIRAGDVLLVSFGHNDEKSDDPTRYTEPQSTFKAYLRQYLDGARAKGATAVLLTPVERRRFSGSTATSSHGGYPAAMRELAQAEKVPLVDLTALSLALWNKLGPEGTKDYFLHLAAGKNSNYPDGVADNTHFQAHGAIEVARLVANGLMSQGILPASDFLRLKTADLPDSLVVWPA